MPEKLPNFIYTATYRTKSGVKDASANSALVYCYTSASRDIPQDASWQIAGFAMRTAASIRA